jgi:UDP:flavonoid glycosyltransferase YjiC (YdhE family)
LRVLVTSTSGTGHIHPLVPLAAEVRAAGHEVVWATPAESCPRVERYGFRAVSAGMSGDERKGLFFERGLDLSSLPVRERRQALLTVMFGQIATPRMRDDLVGIVDELQPDVIIHDLVEFAAAPIAAARGIPHATVAFGGALSPALLAAAAASVADIWTAEGLVPSDSAGLYEHLYLHPLPASFGEPAPSTAVRSVRPMHFDGAAVSEAPDWISGFGRDRPGIYVTFGTEMSGLAPWVEVLDALGSVDADAVATLGSEIDPASVGAIPSNVRVERYVPQTYLLDHATIVVSHAGSGTLFAAAARGLPQLCVPIAADQWDNADALAAAGAGLTLEPEDRDAQTICDTLTRLLDGHAHHDAARALADDFAALPHPREHISTIETLV